MKHVAFTAIVGSLLFSIGTACSSSSTPQTSSSGGGSSVGGNTSAGGSTAAVQQCPAFTNAPDGSGDIKISADAKNNYTFFSQMTFKNLEVPEKSTLTFDWGAVTKDMYGRTIDPKKDIGTLLVTIWNYTKEELQTKINNDELVDDQRKGAGYYFTNGQTTSVTTSQLTSDGATLLPASTLESYFSVATFPAPNYSFLVMIQHDPNTPGKDARMLTTLSLSTDSTKSKTVPFANDSTVLDFAADFSKLVPTLVPAGTNKILIDWSGMTKTAMDRTFDVNSITRVLVASYDQPTSELQKDEKFVDLESIATSMYESNSDDILAPQLSLTKLKDKNGNAFAGIDANRTWILALECGSCRNPAPWYITVLQTCKK